ncbi:MAG: efflux RND transporter permease subunit, partial [Verrucomicrobiia bacterium]
MWIVRLALRRPYTFVVSALVLMLLTPFVLLRMPTDIFPSVDIPVLSVVWLYSGLSAQEIEQRIIYNHERMIATIVDNIEHVESTAYKGAGVIKIFLQPGASVDAAMAQLAATGPAILRQLPRGMNPPIIIRYNASTVPILQYGFASTKFSESELQDMAFNQVRVGLMNVPGASMPYPYGGKPRVVAVDIDPAALKKHSLTPKQVVEAIDAQNLVLPGGSAKIGQTEFDVALNSSPTVLEELNDLPVKSVNGAVIRVRDVAFVHDGYQLQQNIVRLNGVRGVLLTVLKSGAASTLEVVRGVKAAMPRVLRGLPPELQAQEFADQSIFVRAAIDGVLKEGVIAASLTALMVLLFLGAWRGTLIIATSIPLSVLASIAALHALGETINLMTLGGLALSVGMLVDDATVEIENVHRHMAMGKPTVRAILDGAQEIALPAFVGTLCICIVFVPMFFLRGVARFLFVPLAEAVVFAMLASYVLSRTLVPTLVMWFYRRAEYHGHLTEAGHVGAWMRPFVALQGAFERGFARFREGYRRWLGAVLDRRGAFGITFIVFCLGTALLLPWLGQNFFPNVDAGQFRLHFRGHSGLR